MAKFVVDCFWVIRVVRMMRKEFVDERRVFAESQLWKPALRRSEVQRLCPLNPGAGVSRLDPPAAGALGVDSRDHFPKLLSQLY